MMEITCPQNFSGMKNVLVNKEALCRISGRHDKSIADPRQLEDLWLDDVVGLCFMCNTFKLLYYPHWLVYVVCVLFIVSHPSSSVSLL